MDDTKISVDRRIHAELKKFCQKHGLKITYTASQLILEGLERHKDMKSPINDAEVSEIKEK